MVEPDYQHFAVAEESVALGPKRPSDTLMEDTPASGQVRIQQAVWGKCRGQRHMAHCTARAQQASLHGGRLRLHGFQFLSSSAVWEVGRQRGNV